MPTITQWINAKALKYLNTDEHDTRKLIYLSLAFLCIIGSYSVLRSLKTSIFLGFVGKEYQPFSKILGIILMVPAMLGYSKLIDNLRRHQVVYFFMAFYAFVGIGFSIIFIHPVYGVKNNITSVYRITGWAFEIFMDLYQAFVVGSLWSFINSISTPDFANRSYGIIYAASRIGGITTTTLSLVIMSQHYLPQYYTIPGLTCAAALLLLAAAWFVYKVKHTVPDRYLHGYSEQHQATQAPSVKIKAARPSILEGLKLMITQPYVFGIFGVVACYEITSVIFDYQMQVLMSIETKNDIYAMSRFMFLYTDAFQILSFIFALFGTTTLLNYIGVRYCMLIMPAAIIALALHLFFNPGLTTIFVTMIILRALHYGFNKPITEVLYIPTIKDIQFKSKAWIESFGRTLSKSSGATFNIFSALQGSAMYIGIESLFTLGLTSIWIGIAYLVGKKYNKTIKNDQLIGYNADK